MSKRKQLERLVGQLESGGSPGAISSGARWGSGSA